MMRIGVDLDGCVYPYVAAMRAFIVDAYLLDPESLPDPTKWEMWEDWGLSKETWVAYATAAEKSGCFASQEPYEGALHALHHLELAGHSIHIVTHRPTKEAQAQTIKWLETHEVPYDTLTFAKDKTIVATDVFIEDNIDNAEALREVGVRSFLMKRPWNDTGLHHIPFVFNWQDFVEEVEYLDRRTNSAPTDHAHPFEAGPVKDGKRTFESGATRDLDDSKLDFEAYLSPLVLKRYAEYMMENTVMADGSRRDGDNWQKGFGPDSCMKSMWRHFHDVWMLHRGNKVESGYTLDKALCAVLFNSQAYLHEILKDETEGR